MQIFIIQLQKPIEKKREIKMTLSRSSRCFVPYIQCVCYLLTYTQNIYMLYNSLCEYKLRCLLNVLLDTSTACLNLSSILCTSPTPTPDQLGPALLRGSLLTIYIYVYIYLYIYTFRANKQYWGSVTSNDSCNILH